MFWCVIYVYNSLKYISIIYLYVYICISIIISLSIYIYIYAHPTFEDLHVHLWSAKHAYTLYTNKANCTYRYVKHVCKFILDNKVKYKYRKKINILRLLGEGPMEKCKTFRKNPPPKKTIKPIFWDSWPTPLPPRPLDFLFWFSRVFFCFLDVFLGFLEVFLFYIFPSPRPLDFFGFCFFLFSRFLFLFSFFQFQFRPRSRHSFPKICFFSVFPVFQSKQHISWCYCWFNQ